METAWITDMSFLYEGVLTFSQRRWWALALLLSLLSYRVACAVVVGCAQGLLIWNVSLCHSLVCTEGSSCHNVNLGTAPAPFTFRVVCVFLSFLPPLLAPVPTLGSVVSHRLTQMAELVDASQW